MICLVITRRRPGFDPARLPEHYAFLADLAAGGRLLLSGPFDDRSGGGYLLMADSLAEGTRIAREDPLHRHGCSDVEIHGWAATPSGVPWPQSNSA